MNSISVFTTMTKPKERQDPYLEAINCYEELGDELVIVGDDWPDEFKWDHIGKTFQKGFDECSGDWVIRMDLDYFFHEKDLNDIKNFLNSNTEQPAVAFPQYQFFTPDRFQVKTKICVALNKKAFPDIKLNGGGDLCLPTLNNEIILNVSVPQARYPIYQYDSMFRSKEIIKKDRGRFARAWFRQFNDWGDRGGESDEEAFNAWFQMVKSRYKLHTNRIRMESHPEYIKDKIKNLNQEQFGYDAFGLKNNTKRKIQDYLKGYKNRYLD